MMYLNTIIFKQKKYQVIVMLVAILLLFPTFLSAQDEEGYKLKTVVIDAGHGGKDPGTHGVYAQEKEVALKLALKVGRYIEENIPDVKVIYTRKTDVFVKLHERAAIANDNNADLFISIHLNGNESTRPYGSSTYVMGIHKTDENLELAKKENSVILLEEDYESNYEGFEPNSSESYIIFELTQNTFLKQSLSCADFIQHEFEQRARRKNRGVKQAGFVVLWRTTMPSVLIEAGFLTNRTEEKYLITDEGQDYLASAIYRAFKSYKANIESQSNFSMAALDEFSMLEKESNSTTSVQQETGSTSESFPIRFKVQIAASSNPIALDSDYFKGVEDIEEHQFNNIYKYTLGSEKSFESIVELKKQYSELFPDAFIIALNENGEIIPINDALNYKKQ